jgi:1,4-dihydroxy-2-naphthoyl-CoA hydrolase
MYQHRTMMRLRDTDAAGVIYFPHVFDLAHEALEAFMDSVGMNIGLLLRTASFDLPVVHCEADLRQPIFPGHKLLIEISLGDTGESSFTLTYAIRESGGDILATARIVHVMIDRKTRQPMPLTDTLRQTLNQLADDSAAH